MIPDLIPQDLQAIAKNFHETSGLSYRDFSKSIPYWKFSEYRKGESFNAFDPVFRNMGFVATGAFRSYIIDGATGEEKNIFFYVPEEVLVVYESFLNQTLCGYFTEAVTDSTVYHISAHDFFALCAQSKAWENLNKKLLQNSYTTVSEHLLFLLCHTPEERYTQLLKKRPEIFSHFSLLHISSYLGIHWASLSRIRKRIYKVQRI